MTKRILLIVGGGIAAYKSLELVRLLRREDVAVTPVLTAGGKHFVTPLSLGAICGSTVYEDLFSLDDEAAMGHIQLSRVADLVVVCPATADLMASMAGGHARDLATTVLLATDKPVLCVPAMNVRMWLHPATVRNTAQLRADGVTVIEPAEGAMACGEWGPGRLPEPPQIRDAILGALGGDRRLAGRTALVTAGPTREAIDPVRFIENKSSGKQGFAIAEALARAGAEVTLVAGPVALATPKGVRRIDVSTAREMAGAVAAQPRTDVAVMAAAVADWHVDPAEQKLGKADGPPVLVFAPNPDILATLAAAPNRPRLLIGFAAETRDVAVRAVAKRARKGADWIVANDVSGDVMGGDRNTVQLVTAGGVEGWPDLPKADVASRLVDRIAAALA